MGPHSYFDLKRQIWSKKAFFDFMYIVCVCVRVYGLVSIGVCVWKRLEVADLGEGSGFGRLCIALKTPELIECANFVVPLV